MAAARSNASRLGACLSPQLPPATTGEIGVAARQKFCGPVSVTGWRGGRNGGGTFPPSVPVEMGCKEMVCLPRRWLTLRMLPHWHSHTRSLWHGTILLAGENVDNNVNVTSAVQAGVEVRMFQMLLKIIIMIMYSHTHSIPSDTSSVQRLSATVPPQLGKSSNPSHSFGICLL